MLSIITRLVRGWGKAGTALLTPTGITASSLAFSAIVLVGFGLYAWHSRNDHLHRAEASLLSVTRALEHHAARSFAAADRVLRSVAVQSKTLHAATAWSEEMQAVLVERATASPIVWDIIVLDAQGAVIADSQSFPPRPMNASDRPYFTVHRDSDSDQLYISATFKSRLSGRTRFGMSRRFSVRIR